MKMTREEAIKMAKAKLRCIERDTSGTDKMCNNHECEECSLNYEQGNMGEQKEWLRMAIKALEQEPCEDAISRSDILERCQLVIGQGLSDKNGYHMLSAETVMYVVKQLPSINPQPKTGHWIDKSKQSACGVKFIHIECSECGELSGLNNTYARYCPWCGVKMVEPQESEEE